jgi:hypothetical protein
VRQKNIAQHRCWLELGLLGVLLCALLACSPTQGTSQTNSGPGPRGQVSALLPGEQVWRQGVSSLLFGTNDTQEWQPRNIETQPTIQQALRTAGFTLVRTFFPDNAADAVIEQRISTIERIGASCLGVLPSIFNAADDLHLVKYLGRRCLLYEFGNEPDYTGIPWNFYLAQWNKIIPQLRRVNPQARFIGPVLAYTNSTYLINFLDGVKLSRVLPDALSIHWYPCWKISQSRCMAQADGISGEVQSVRSIAQIILGRSLPIGVTEWNFDPGNPPASYGDNSDFITRFSEAALLSMIHSKVAFACQFDAASYAGYGHLDLFNVQNNQPKPQFYAIEHLIELYKPA